jgi:hypothetical protein
MATSGGSQGGGAATTLCGGGSPETYLPAFAAAIPASHVPSVLHSVAVWSRPQQAQSWENWQFGSYSHGPISFCREKQRPFLLGFFGSRPRSLRSAFFPFPSLGGLGVGAGGARFLGGAMLAMSLFRAASCLNMGPLMNLSEKLASSLYAYPLVGSHVRVFSHDALHDVHLL